MEIHTRIQVLEFMAQNIGPVLSSELKRYVEKVSTDDANQALRELEAFKAIAPLGVRRGKSYVLTNHGRRLINGETSWE